MNELPTSLKLATVWLVLGTAVFLGVQHFERERAQTRLSVLAERIEIRRGDDGHYHWRGRIEGEAVDFLVDTGATHSALSSALAERLKLPTQGRIRTQTAAGESSGSVVRADVTLEGGVRIERLAMVALPQLGEQPLLGMDVLGRLDWRQGAGVLIVERRADTSSSRP
jgi:aspartyl protease family protein